MLFRSVKIIFYIMHISLITYSNLETIPLNVVIYYYDKVAQLVSFLLSSKHNIPYMKEIQNMRVHKEMLYILLSTEKKNVRH